MVSSHERTMNSPAGDAADMPRCLAEALQEGLARAATRRVAGPGPRTRFLSIGVAKWSVPARAGWILRRFGTALAAALGPRADEAARDALLAYARDSLLGARDGGERSLRDAGVTPYQQAVACGLLMECVCLELLEAPDFAFVGGGDGAAQAAGTVRMLGDRLRSPAARDRVEDADCCRSVRRRIARDLHDHVGAALGAARRHLHGAVSEAGSPAMGLEALDTALGEAEHGVRQVLHDLHGALVVPGLRDALHEFVATEFPPSTPVAVKWTGNEGLLSQAQRRGIFLVLREALRNSLRHAPGHAVTVSVRVTRWWAHAAVQDDGPGFDPGHAPGVRGHVGLDAMRDRMEDLGGRLTVTSAPGDGTRVDVRLPLPR
ncbi:sensor histidine kinase [Streptomyces lancefieldiae]|uniref:ATP-binding protein n=1 Tax=Streptomyces lancefieldiae TaxID=3075520 RepID=A0ABU3AZF2_9ACTN|nr:ATP-binding protein [Streptomyces sp. DSM 40712]MDT0615389.1 ATP-binding protein [Streptomyces sp. DSM 40712]